ncbi:hypothetical protein Tco_0930868 [Tanacetum coccineum]
MGSYRSKEDDVSRISTSIYVSNFPESFSAKDFISFLKQMDTLSTLVYPTKGREEWEEVFLIRAKEVPGWVPEFVDDSDDDDESDDGFKDGDAKVQDGGSCGDASDMVEVPETVFEESLEQKETQSEDPFGIYSLLNKNKDKSENMKPSDHSLKYPPGFTPNDLNGQERNSINKGSKEEVSGLVCSGNFKKSEVPRTGGSILCVLEELVKLGQAMGYNMDGCVNNMTEIIESQGASEDYTMNCHSLKIHGRRPRKAKKSRKLGQGVVY